MPPGATTTHDVPTRHGAARVHLTAPATAARGALVLGHGAGGGVDAPDLREVADVAAGAGWLVALVEQPYRVQGRKGPPRAPTLDGAWEDVVGDLVAGPLAGLPLVVGGRSSGARVACRTAAATGAAAVLVDPSSADELAQGVLVARAHHAAAAHAGRSIAAGMTWGAAAARLRGVYGTTRGAR